MAGANRKRGKQGGSKRKWLGGRRKKKRKTKDERSRRQRLVTGIKQRKELNRGLE